MLEVVALTLAIQAALPPSSTPFSAETHYAGPGLLCGAAFAIRLEESETAVRLKSSAIDDVLQVQLQEGTFTVRETQYNSSGAGDRIRLGDGSISREVVDGQSRWVYRDAAPGSTTIYGPAVEASRFTPALQRIIFRSPHSRSLDGESCMSDQRR